VEKGGPSHFWHTGAFLLSNNTHKAWFVLHAEHDRDTSGTLEDSHTLLINYHISTSRESANFSALRPNNGYQKFGPSLGSEIRLFTPKIIKNPPKFLISTHFVRRNDGSS